MSRLDVVRKAVILDDGSDVPYDGVVIATGSRARRLGSGALAGRGVEELALRTLEDAILLRRRLLNKPSVVVLGGGALGMEIASGCLAAGCEVTLVSQERPLLKQLGSLPVGGLRRCRPPHRAELASSQAVELRDGGGHPLVALADGSVVEGDLVVSAVGDQPNVEWLADSGLLTNGTLEVDSRGRLRPDIVAAGDVAAFPTLRGVRRVPLWTSAIEQSKVAALALVQGGKAPELDFQPYFWTEQFGLSLKASGFLPLTGLPEFVDGDPHDGPALLRWPHADGSGTAVAINYRIPIPKLRKLSHSLPLSASSVA